MVKILVLGATGFLGLPIALSLRRAGHQVYGLARTAEKVALLAKHEIQAVHGSVDDSEYLRVIESENIDVVVDAAAVNQGGSKILEDVLMIGKARLDKGSGRLPKLGFVYVSGIWVHGTSNLMVNDLDLVGIEQSIAPPSAMVAWRPGHERRILETIDILNPVIIRPSMMYGGNEWVFAQYFSLLVEAVKKKKPSVSLPIDASTMLGLSHVEDVAAGIHQAVEKIELVTSGNVYPVFDFSSTYESAQSLLEAAARALGYTGKILFVGPGDNIFAEAVNTSVKASSIRAKNLLGWNPKMPSMTEDIHLHVASWLASSGGK
jgi:nucleoside-diphosphate-sugar epimerase